MAAANGLKQVSLCPGAVPDAKPAKGPEDESTPRKDKPVAGKAWRQIGNVTRPGFTVYSPTNLPVTKWSALVETWLGTIGMIPAR